MAKEILAQDRDKIRELSLSVLGHEDIADITRLGGMTNHTYRVSMSDGSQYVFRIPGEGTEELICRADEKKSTALACELGIDSPMLYFGDNGEKVTEYIKNARTMKAPLLREDKAVTDVAAIFKKLHTCGVDTGVRFEVFEMAAAYSSSTSMANAHGEVTPNA